jgi:hypothetical protein
VSSSVATYLIRKYGTCGRSLAKFLKVKTRVGNDVLNVAWNWHIYGPQGTSPSEGMTTFTRKQIKCLPENIHPLIDSLIKEVQETP